MGLKLPEASTRGIEQSEMIETLAHGEGLVDVFGPLVEAGYLDTYVVRNISLDNRPFGCGIDKEVVADEAKLAEYLESQRAMYEFKRKFVLLDGSDPYDFALLENSMAMAKMNNIEISPEELEEYNQYFLFLGRAYKKALESAVIEEFLEYGIYPEGGDLPIFGSKNQTVSESYKAFLESNGQAVEQLELAVAEIARLTRIRSDELVNYTDGWNRAVAIALRLSELYQNSAQATNVKEVMKAIDLIHTTTHNGGGLMSHMLGQVSEDHDLLALVELNMRGNLELIYQKSSSYARDLSERLGGRYHDLQETDKADRELDEQRYGNDYFNSVYGSIKGTLQRIGHGETAANPQSILLAFSEEVGLNLGLKAKKMIEDLVPVINEVIPLWVRVSRVSNIDPEDKEKVERFTESVIDQFWNGYSEGVILKNYRDWKRGIPVEEEFAKVFDEEDYPYWDKTTHSFVEPAP